jgi:hypothetical protein
MANLRILVSSRSSIECSSHRRIPIRTPALKLSARAGIPRKGHPSPALSSPLPRSPTSPHIITLRLRTSCGGVVHSFFSSQTIILFEELSLATHFLLYRCYLRRSTGPGHRNDNRDSAPRQWRNTNRSKECGSRTRCAQPLDAQLPFLTEFRRAEREHLATAFLLRAPVLSLSNLRLLCLLRLVSHHPLVLLSSTVDRYRGIGRRVTHSVDCHATSHA